MSRASVKTIFSYIRTFLKATLPWSPTADPKSYQEGKYPWWNPFSLHF